MEQPGVSRAASGVSAGQVLVSWSSGKDGAWLLHRLRQNPNFEVAALLTTVTEDDPRVAIHEVPAGIVRAQARCLGLPLREVALPWPCSNEVYRDRVTEALAPARDQGAKTVAFGDLFLEDIRAFREELLAGTGFEALFPLWGEDTGGLAEEMITGGQVARVVAVDRGRWGDRERAEAALGRTFDEAFLADLPDTVDPCGEHGEFHTLVTQGPGFREPLRVRAVGRWRRGSHSGLRLELEGSG